MDYSDRIRSFEQAFRFLDFNSLEEKQILALGLSLAGAQTILEKLPDRSNPALPHVLSFIRALRAKVYLVASHYGPSANVLPFPGIRRSK